jgi:hypothetical protein
MNELFIRVVRKQDSYKYKFDMAKIDSWENNKANNSLDDFILFVDEARMFTSKCQTVANIPFGRYTDTIVPGPFQIKCFVENRMKYGKIHGIINTYDLDGQKIDENSVETVKGKDGAPVDLMRWLIHDWQSNKPKSANYDTSVAWSAGCFVMSDNNLETFGSLLSGSYGIKPGDIINGELVDE